MNGANASIQLVQIAAELRDAADRLEFSKPVTHVYNPLRYAWAMHEAYLRRYGGGRKRVLFLGMNPGPWGMAQTGVPFGEVAHVRDWLKLDELIGKPTREHEKRPVVGLECHRNEVSGERLWGLFKQQFGSASRFFKNHLVVNYCPLVFMESSARNRTPDKLPKEEREPLEQICDDHLQQVVEATRPAFVVGVGKFAEKKAIAVAQQMEDPPSVACILHPSPASPAANRGWAQQAEQQLRDAGVWT